MKRSLFIAIVVLLMAALFVSCNAEKSMEDQLFEVTIDGGARALSATGTQDVDVEELFWYFSATKASGLFRTGETEWKAVKDIAGISGASLGPFSKGSWTFSFYGFTSAQAEKPADPATAAVYYQTGLAQDISQAVALTLSLTKGVLPVATIEFTEGGITWTYAAGGANLTLEMEILEGTTAIEFEDNVTRLPGEYDATSGSYVFTLDDAMELTEGAHAFTVNVYNIDGQDEELVGKAEITITAVNGMRYVVSGSVEITDELNEVTIGGADAPVAAQAPVVIAETGSTVVETSNAPAEGKTTTVSFPEGALADNTTLTVETSATATVENSFVVNAGNEVQAAISLSLADDTTTFNNEEVTVTTFVEKNLTDVHVYYNVDGDETDYLESYDPSTGELVFKTTHFSEFVVTGKAAAAKIGDTVYATLMEAIDSVEKYEEAEIVLLRDVIDGTGLSTDSRNADSYPKYLTIDFAGYTYTMKDPAVGSTGTQTQAMHWADNSTIVLKNGTFKVQEDAVNVKQAMQNYANLTIENMVIDLSAVPAVYYGENEFTGVYAVYNGMPCPIFNVNRGSMTIKNSTITLNSECGDYGINVSTNLYIYNSTINAGIVLDEPDAMVLKYDGTTTIANGVHPFFEDGYTLIHSDEPAYGYDSQAELWLLAEGTEGPFGFSWPMLMDDEGEW